MSFNKHICKQEISTKVLAKTVELQRKLTSTHYPKKTKNMNHVSINRIQNADTVIQDYRVTDSTSEAKTPLSLTFSELEEIRSKILAKEKCSDSDLEKLAIINEKLGDLPMKDKLKNFNYIVLGMGFIAGILLSIILKPQPQQTFAVPANSGGTAPVIYNIDNN